MRSLAALSAAVLLLAGVLWFVLRAQDGAPPRTPPPVAEAAPPADALAEHAAVSPAVDAPVAPPREAAPEAPKEEPAAVREPQLAEIRGRFLLEGGAPAGGVALHVQGWQANQERVLAFGLPADWKDPVGTSAPDGTFSVRFDPPRAFQFVFEGKLPGCSEASWRWSEVAPGEVKDLGDVVLQRAGAIAGRVVDAQGRPVPGEWQIHADGPPRSGSEGVEPARVHATADRTTAEFRLEDVPPGTSRLKAYLRIVNWIDGPAVEVRPGETTTADIVYSGPDFSRRITVVTFARPFYTFDDDANEIVLTGPGLEPRTAKRIEHSSQSFAFEDVPPGRYTVSIDDPKFLPWSQDGVEPGTSVNARLRGGAAVRLAVVEAGTKAPIERYGLRVRFDQSNSRPNEFEVHSLDEEPPAGGLFEGLIAVPQTLIVRAPGHADAALALGGLQRGETRALTAELGRGTTLKVLVTESDGATPVAEVEVVLESVPTAESQPSSVRFLGERDLRKARTEADGRVRLDAVPPGTYALRARRGPFVEARAEDVVVAAADAEREVRLVLPPCGWLAGRLLADAGAAFDAFTVEAEPSTLSAEERLRARFASDDRNAPGGRPGRVAPDGSFRVGPLPAGTMAVSLSLPAVDSPSSHGSMGMEGGRRALGEVEVAAGGETRRDFDVRALLPGRVEVRATLGGAPASSAVVDLRPVGTQEWSGAVALLDAQGHGLSSPLFPGRVRALVRELDGAWRWNAPGELEVRAGETLQVRWEIALVTGTLTLQDAATSAPIGGRELWIELEGGDGDSTNAKTDAQGKVELRLAPGRYRISLPPRFEGRQQVEPMRQDVAGFDWTANGAVPSAVKLPPAPPR